MEGGTPAVQLAAAVSNYFFQGPRGILITRDTEDVKIKINVL